jgi:hypothetical protein
MQRGAPACTRTLQELFIDQCRGIQGAWSRLYEAPGVASLVVACLILSSIGPDALHAFVLLQDGLHFASFGASARGPCSEQ